jgi:hypothetical protein
MNLTQKRAPAGSTEPGPLGRDTSLYGSLCVLGTSMLVFAALLLPGCSNPSVAHAVDPPQARDALKTALDEWKKGESVESLASASTPIIVQDFDWMSGAKLVEYELVDEGKAVDANLSIQVKLTLSGGSQAGKAAGKAAGKTIQKKVWYLVTTSPKLTVFRDSFRK